MLYGLLELSFVVVVVAFLTAPLWAKRPIAWMTRPFGTDRQDEPNTAGKTNEAKLDPRN